MFISHPKDYNSNKTWGKDEYYIINYSSSGGGDLIRNGPFTAGEYAERLQIRHPLASKHLSGLHKSGAVEFMRKQFVEFTSFAQSHLALNIWFEQDCEIWEERLDSLELYLKKLQKL